MGMAPCTYAWSVVMKAPRCWCLGGGAKALRQGLQYYSRLRPHQIDFMFHGLLISKNRPGWQAKKEEKLMNIIIKPQKESQHTTKSHHLNWMHVLCREDLLGHHYSCGVSFDELDFAGQSSWNVHFLKILCRNTPSQNNVLTTPHGAMR